MRNPDGGARLAAAGSFRIARHRAWMGYLAISSLATMWKAAGGPTALYAAVAFGAVAAVLVSALANRNGRIVLFGVGLGCWAVGNVVWLHLHPNGVGAFPSAADAFYLLGYVGLLTAMRRSVRVHAVGRDATVDALIVAAGTAGFVGIYLFDTMLSASAPLWARVVAVSYPVLTLVLAWDGLRILLANRTKRPALAMLAAGFAIQLVADAMYSLSSVTGTLSGGAPEQLGWLAAYTLFGTAALHPSLGELPARRYVRDVSVSSSRIAMLAAASLAPLLGHVCFGLPAPVAVVGCFAVTIASLVRIAGPIERMRRTAWYDDLTGLLNRPAILDVIDDTLAQAGSAAVLHCNIDGLRQINDALGHVAGDALIQVMAGRLEKVPGSHRAARVTGDEFVVVAADGSEASAVDLARRIQADVRADTSVGGLVLRPTMSIGIAIGTVDGGAADLLRRAATACADRTATREHLCVASAEDDGFLRLRLAQDLRDALARREITVDFQPEVHAASGRLFAFEALARWHHPTLGPIRPDVFVPIAEETGLVRELFQAVLDDALAAQHAWSAVGAPVPVGVNMSPLQLVPSVIDDIRAAVDRWHPPAGGLWIELTESAGADLEEALPIISELRGAGVQLAIDDFGTGHSSLARLAAIKWNAIKIDRSFVDRLLTERDAHAVTAATIGMAKHLGMVTIGEGVETIEQRDELIRLGCDVTQGYLLSRPLPAAAAIALVKADNRWPVSTAVSQAELAR